MSTTSPLCSIIVIACLVCSARAADLDAGFSLAAGINVSQGGNTLCSLQPGAFDKTWRGAASTVSSYKDIPADSTQRKFKVVMTGGARIDGSGKVSNDDGKLSGEWTFTPAADIDLNSLHISASFSIEQLAGAKWKTDDKSGEFPKDFKDIHLFSAPTKSLALELPNGTTLQFDFKDATSILLQDDRQWGPSFSIRIIASGAGASYKKDSKHTIAFTLSSKSPIKLHSDGLTTITAGPEWIPFKNELDIEPGSALDFSSQNFTDGPAGKFGRVIAKGNDFVFEKDPDAKPRRFYGVNLCFGAQYLDPAECERVAERFWRLGYNSIRIHHYEGLLVEGQKDSTQLNPQRIEQLDTLIAALKKRGIYITTDLFVSRPVKWKDIGIEKDGNVPMDTFKILVPVVPAAFENWKAFAKSFLLHKNAKTELTYAEDPVIAWLSMINEGNFGNFVGELRKYPEWQAAWKEWLNKRYKSQDDLAKSWGAELKKDEDLLKGSVALPDNIYNGNPRTRDAFLFFTDVEIDMIERMKKFLRDELKCNALITNSNAWTHPLCMQFARMHYDYVDDHFYVDHPHFLENPWSLPSSCPNTSPIRSGAQGGRSCAFLRIEGKPMTITEYNYSAPGRFRGVGGILTGALGALQGWAGIWRFGYSHSKDGMLQATPLNYFDMGRDPLGQAAERASFCLFTRGDMKTATVGALQTLSDEHFTTEWGRSQKSMPWAAPKWSWAPWVYYVGFSNDENQVQNLAWKNLAALRVEAGQSIEPLQMKGQSNLDPAKNIFHSPMGEFFLDGQQDMMVLDTPRTAGGYAPAGAAIKTRGDGLAIQILDSDATVWISTLDKEALDTSTHLLLTHLTDCQNTDIKYAESARQTLLEWGKLPHLIRAGKANIRLKNVNAEKLKVWALSASGKRVAEVPAQAEGGVLSFTADVAANAEKSGAQMCYEIGEK